MIIIDINFKTEVIYFQDQYHVCLTEKLSQKKQTIQTAVIYFTVKASILINNTKIEI